MSKKETMSITEFKSLLPVMSSKRTAEKAFGCFGMGGHEEVCKKVQVGDNVKYIKLTENKSNDDIPAIGLDIVEAVLV